VTVFFRRAAAKLLSTNASRISRRAPIFSRRPTHALLYQRGGGKLGSALELPTVE